MSKNNYKTQHIIINALVFYLGWWACVLIGNTGAWVVLPATFAVNAYLFKQPQKEVWLWLVIGLLGLVNDTLLLLAGIIVRPDSAWWPPFWLTSLWILFAATLPYSLYGLVQRTRLFYVLCGLGGAASYIAGVRLTSMTWGVPEWLGGMILLVNWLIVGYLLIKVIKIWQRKYALYPAA